MGPPFLHHDGKGRRDVSMLNPRLLFTICLVAAGVSLGWLSGRLFWPRDKGLWVERRVQWRLFGEAFIGEEQLPPKMGSIVERVLGKNTDVTEEEQTQVSSVFNVQQLKTELHKFPLACCPGDEGLLPKKYDRFLQSLAEYAVFHKRATARDDKRVLVWQCDMSSYCGGLADRLKGITYSLLLAMFSKRRLLLNWSSGEQVYLKPNVINWVTDPNLWNTLLDYYYDDDEDGNFTDSFDNYDDLVYLHMFSILGGNGIDMTLEDVNNTLNIIEGIWPKVIFATNLEPNALMNDTKRAGQNWIANGLKQFGLDFLSPEELDGIGGIVFRYLFQITSKLLFELSIARGILGLEGQNYTGVHIRTGFAGSPLQEYVDHPKLIRKTEEWEDILKCAVTTADQWLSPSSLIFLATDSYLVKHLAVTKYGSRFHSLENTLVHLDRMEKYPHTPLQNETEGTLSTWVDFLLLAEAQVQVMTGSGFAMAAGQLCSLPQQRIVNGLHCV